MPRQPFIAMGLILATVGACDDGGWLAFMRNCEQRGGIFREDVTGFGTAKLSCTFRMVDAAGAQVGTFTVPDWYNRFVADADSLPEVERAQFLKNNFATVNKITDVFTDLEKDRVRALYSGGRSR